MRAIDGDALYEKTAAWEAQAEAQVEKLIRTPVDEMTSHEYAEWKRWTYIWNERTAFKHDIADAPTIEPKRGRWEYIGGYGHQYRCSECITCVERKYRFCPNCGADMREAEEEVLEMWNLDGSPTQYIKGERMDESTMGQLKVDVSINKPTERWDTCGLSENDILVDSGARGERHDE